MSKLTKRTSFILLISISILLSGFLIWFTLVKAHNKVSSKGQDTVNYKEEGIQNPAGKENLPEDFPADFPVYPGAKTISSKKSDEKDSQGFSLVLQTPDSPNKVNSFYSSELTKAGWSVENTFKGAGSATLSFNKDFSKGFIGIVENGGQVIISLSLGTSK